MDKSNFSDFEILEEKDALVLQAGSCLPKVATTYLQNHLDRLNRFKLVGRFQDARSFSFYDPPLPSLVGKRSMVHRLMRVFEKKKMPASATLALTYACQCDCVHCSCSSNVRNEPPLSTSQWKQVVDETIELGATTIVFTGGEPLIRKDIVELIQHVDKNRANVVIFTNGDLLDSEMCNKLYHAGLYAAFISLDSADEKKHDRLR